MIYKQIKILYDKCCAGMGSRDKNVKQGRKVGGFLPIPDPSKICLTSDSKNYLFKNIIFLFNFIYFVVFHSN